MIELVIYIALLAFLLLFVVSGTIATYRAFTLARIDQRLVINGDNAFATLIRDVRGATSLDSASSVFGSNPGTLVVGTKRYTLSGGRLQLIQGNTIQNITASNASVTDLQFYRSTTTTGTELVTVRMTLQAGSGALQRSRQYYGSVLLRGEY